MTSAVPPAGVAIYDLDRTVLRKPTFTLFLLWAAWREARSAFSCFLISSH